MPHTFRTGAGRADAAYHGGPQIARVCLFSTNVVASPGNGFALIMEQRQRLAGFLGSPWPIFIACHVVEFHCRPIRVSSPLNTSRTAHLPRRQSQPYHWGNLMLAHPNPSGNAPIQWILLFFGMSANAHRRRSRSSRRPAGWCEEHQRAAISRSAARVSDR